MPIVEWNEGQSVGVPEIDQHHQHLVNLLNKAYDAFRAGKKVSPLLLDQLTSFTEHFPYEDRLMAETGYPQKAEHLDEHELFTRTIAGLHKRIRRNRDVTVDLLWFLSSWVTHHARETDRELGSYLAALDTHQIATHPCKLPSNGQGEQRPKAHSGEGRN